MNETKVRSIVRTMLMSFDNDVVPQHRHNGVDSPTIPIQNIVIVAGVGLPLTNGKFAYNLYIDPVDNELELLPNKAFVDPENPPEPVKAKFNIGETGSPFYDVSINTTDEFQSNVIDTGGSNQFSQIPGITNNAVSDGVTFSTEQITPNVKRFTSSDPTFQLTVNNTNYVPTSDGTTGIGVVPTGTVDLVINGVTYHVLHT